MQRILQLEVENDIIAAELIKEQSRAEKVERELQERFQTEQASHLRIAQEKQNLERACAELREENSILNLEGRKVKDTVREEMGKQEREIDKLTKINDEYKTIVSNMSAEMERLKAQLVAAQSGSIEVPQRQTAVDQDKCGSAGSVSEKMEVELAKCKLDLVESQCKVQELEHSLGENQRELNNVKNRSWLSRFNSSTSRNNSGD